MIYVRGHYSNYDDWLRAGNTGWGYNDTLPYFKKLETNPVVDADYHGNEGPLIVSYKPCPEGGCGVFIEATMEMGYDGPDWNFNGSRQENGSGLYQLSVKDGIRQSAATAFLNPALSRPNLEVKTFAQVTKLHFSGKRVAGVEYLQAGKLQQVYSTDEVILSAGAVETPKILMLSGIGPEDHLRAFGIKVISNLPGVGNNLQDHLSSGLIYEANSPIPTLDFPECAGLFTRTKYASSNVAPDLQFMFYHLPGTKGNSSFLFLPILASPRSRGNITLKSTNPYHSPVIHANYFKQEEDVEVLVEGFKLAEEIADTKTFRMQRYGHGKTFKSEKQIKEYIYNSASTMYHPVGTCKMGKDNMAVVQPDLTVYGVHGVR